MESTSELTIWLEQLGLERYASNFAEQEIDFAILPELSENDLQEIGLPLGPRRKIQKALAGSHRHLAKPLPTDSAERRQLTVMFADLVGSSEMSTQMDAEELREIMRAFQDVSKTAIEKFQGFVARYMGDGVLAYFGYPLAHENDPERSVRAGLELVKMTASLNTSLSNAKDVNLRVRVGIATGPVVVGDLIGEGASSESAVVGETPNIAARIEASAPANSVVVGQDTYRHLGEHFETEKLGTKTLKGFAAPVHLYRIVSERRIESRFKATRAANQVPFIGRKKELGILQKRWSAACESNGSAFLVNGEAGVGKSRFLQEFLEHVALTDPTIVQFQCSPFHLNTSFHPIIEQLAALAQLQQGETEEISRDRLARLILETCRPREESLQLLAWLLSVPIGEKPPPKLLENPPRLLNATHDMLVEQILARSEHGPVLVVFEDAHWMDPTTIETVMRLGRACNQQRLFLVVTSRPQATVEQAVGSIMHSIVLPGLSQSETELLIRSVPDGNSLTPTAFNAVMQRTDGIPLFIEELTKLVLERGDADDASVSSIPTTLAGSLTERLDRLGSAKEVAQIGATIGREFSHDLLSRIDGRVAGVMQRDISQLIEAELIQSVGYPDYPVYRFKHALVQDAAYDTLLLSRRRRHHSQIADALLEVSRETTHEKPELIAHHLSKGGRPLEAVDYWQIAGESATGRSANAEAIHHISMGITALHSLSTALPEHLQKELDLQVALGAPLVAARGYACSELEKAYSRASKIGEQLDGGIKNFRVLWGLSSYYLIRGQLKKSLDLQRASVVLAEHDKKPEKLVQASSWLGTILFYRSEFEESAKWLRRAVENYQIEPSAGQGYQYGLDPMVLAQVHLVWLHWLMGQTAKAHALDEENLTFAKALGHPLSHAHALNFSVVLHSFQGNFSVALSRADSLLYLSQKREFPHYIAYAKIMRGLALARLGNVDEGIDDMVAGLKARRDTGAELVRPMFLTMLADILADNGQYTRSLEALDEADSIVEINGERWYQAESKRVRGIVLNRLSPGSTVALEHVLSALDGSRKLGVKSLEMRALVSLIEIQNGKIVDGKENTKWLQRLATLVAELPQSVQSLDRQRSHDLLKCYGYD